MSNIWPASQIQPIWGFNPACLMIFEKKKENTQTLRIQETFVKLYIIKYEDVSNSLMHVNEEEKLFTVIFGL